MIVTERKRTSAFGKNDTHGKLWASVRSLSAHHSGWSKSTNTEEGQGEGVLKNPNRAQTLSSCAWTELLIRMHMQKSKLNWTAYKHAHAKVKTCLKPMLSTFLGWQGVGVLTAVTRHWGSAIRHGRGSHWSSVTLWCRDHCHPHSVCAFIHVTPDAGTAEVLSISTGPKPNFNLQSSEVTGNPQGTLFFLYVPFGSSNINAGKSCFWTCV